MMISVQVKLKLKLKLKKKKKNARIQCYYLNDYTDYIFEQKKIVEGKPHTDIIFEYRNQIFWEFIQYSVSYLKDYSKSAQSKINSD